MNIILRSLVSCLSGVLIAAVPGTSQAQSWFTRDVCLIEDVRVDPAVLDDSQIAAFEVEARAAGNGLGRFWRITSPAGKVSHLWGTLHASSPDILRLPDVLTDAIARARSVGVEFDPTSLTRTELTRQFQAGDFYLKEGEQPYKSLDPRVRRWIEARLAGVGYGAGWLDAIHPAALAEILLYHPCLDFSAGVLPVQDSHIQTLGVLAGARIVGLEPWHAFRDAMRQPVNLPIVLAIIETYGSLLSPDLPGEGHRTGLALYLQGRIGVMQAWDRAATIEFFGKQKGGRLHDLMDGYLVAARNRGFAASAKPLLEEGDAVIAVGAFHLPGPDGLVSLFRTAGYRLERIPVPGEIAAHR